MVHFIKIIIYAFVMGFTGGLGFWLAMFLLEHFYKKKVYRGNKQKR